MRPQFRLLAGVFFISGNWITGLPAAYAQVNGDFSVIRAEIDFANHYLDWDGFGFNYVETTMTADYDQWAQDYGGFSIMSEETRKEILELVFGEDGLRPGVMKLFLDPLHQDEPGGAFDHEKTTSWMLEFAERGLEMTRSRGSDLQMITTLYGLPAWATKQGEIRGRDLDPTKKEAVVEYLVDWVAYLEQRGLPIAYLSLHNEGDKPSTYPLDGHSVLGYRKDYNSYWPPEQVVEFLPLVRKALDERGLNRVGVTPGESSRWHWFDDFGYADAIAASPEAMASLGLITSHGFHKGVFSEWSGEQRSNGIDLLREKKPGLHAWTCSASFMDMSVEFLMEAQGNIYNAKTNAYIPWAPLQRPEHWLGEEWNPGTAIRVDETGHYELLRGYYYFKQISRAGQPGMAVVRVMAIDKYIKILAFAGNGTGHPDAFVIMNFWDEDDRKVGIRIRGSDAATFEAFRTNDAGTEQYTAIGEYSTDPDRILYYTVPARSATTFFQLNPEQGTNKKQP